MKKKKERKKKTLRRSKRYILRAGRGEGRGKVCWHFSTTIPRNKETSEEKEKETLRIPRSITRGEGY